MKVDIGITFTKLKKKKEEYTQNKIIEYTQQIQDQLNNLETYSMKEISGIYE